MWGFDVNFTSRQALDAGYGDNLHPYHVRAGNWVRERRGVYRLTQFPQPSRPDLMVLQLWSRNRQDEPQGVFSHSTALSLHDLSDAMPAKVDMTVPPGFRRMAAIPGVLRLHRGNLAERDSETIEGVRVTTPLRTLIDVIVDGALAPEVLVQAVDEASRAWPTSTARRSRSSPPLQREDTRLEASEMLRGLIDSIVLVPDEGQLRMELKGKSSCDVDCRPDSEKVAPTGPTSGLRRH